MSYVRRKCKNMADEFQAFVAMFVLWTSTLGFSKFIEVRTVESFAPQKKTGLHMMLCALLALPHSTLALIGSTWDPPGSRMIWSGYITRSDTTACLQGSFHKNSSLFIDFVRSFDLQYITLRSYGPFTNLPCWVCAMYFDYKVYNHDEV